MKKLALIITLLAAIGFAAMAQQHPARLKFNCDGTFKIVQITDTHFKWGKKASQKAIECIKAVIDEEDPDFVIFTGDQVYSKGVEKSLQALTAPLIERAIPYATIFGNHDHQHDMTRPAMYDLVQAQPYCAMPPRAEGVDSPDYALPVYSNDGKSIVRVLYCMDTHDKAAANKVGGGYDWLTAPQIAWYRTTSDEYTKANGDTPLPALLFIHIPLPEYQTAVDADPKGIIGNKKEKICCSALNSGMFAAIKEQGDIRGVFCGHDHDNDFLTTYRDVLLAYGRYSGGKTVYNHLGTNGARVILLDEKNPDTIETWIRLRDGKLLDRYTFNPTADKKK